MTETADPTETEQEYSILRDTRETCEAFAVLLGLGIILQACLFGVGSVVFTGQEKRMVTAAARASIIATGSFVVVFLTISLSIRYWRRGQA